MNETVLSFFVFSLCVLPYYFIHWWIRLRFIVDGYRVSGSYMKKNKKYRNEWSWLQRVVLLPFFSHQSTRRFGLVAVINYLHFITILFTIIGYIRYEHIENNMLSWEKGLICGCIMMLVQLIIVFM